MKNKFIFYRVWGGIALLACLLGFHSAHANVGGVGDHLGGSEGWGLASPKMRYAGVVEKLQDLARRYPGHAEVFNLGVSDSGENIVGIRLGNGPTQNLVVGTHHGNEYGSTEVALAFADSVAAAPIADQTLFVIPVLNIDGYNSGRREERDFKGRTHDPNRDYEGPCKKSDIYGESFRLRSTSALAEFLQETDIVNSATLHTFYPGVLYPWGFGADNLDTGFTNIFMALGAAAVHLSNYVVGNSTELLYPAEGTFEDYAFWKHGVWSMLFEIGHSHSPNPKQIQEMVAKNVPGLRRMFEQAPLERASNHGFTGQCTNASLLLDRRDE